MGQVQGAVVQAIDQEATTETRDSCRRTTNLRTCVGLTTAGLGYRQSDRDRRTMESDPQGTGSRTTSVYRPTDRATLPLNRIGKAQDQGSTPTSSPDSTSQKFNRFLLRDGKTDQGLESRQEHLVTGSELITEAQGTIATRESRVETGSLKSTIGRRVQSEKRTQAAGQLSSTGSTVGRRKETFPKTGSRLTPSQGNRLLQSQLLCQGNSPRTNSKAQGSRDSHRALTSPK